MPPGPLETWVPVGICHRTEDRAIKRPLHVACKARQERSGSHLGVVIGGEEHLPRNDVEMASLVVQAPNRASDVESLHLGRHLNEVAQI